MNVDTIPAAVTQTTVEDITWGVDMTALLSGSQTVTAPAAKLTSRAGAVTLPDLPAVSGNIVAQRIRSGVLTAGPGGTGYRLEVTFTPSGTTNILDAVLDVYCPF